MAEELTPGAKEDKTVTFVASGAGNTLFYNAVAPFPETNRLSFYPSTYGQNTDEQTNRNRYQVAILFDGGDVDAPVKLIIDKSSYPLSYYETDQGLAVYRTTVIPVGSDRMLELETLQV